MKADPTVNHVELDGHSDNSGNRLTNRDLSRRRALSVVDYFKAKGIPEEQITLRFHGERYPLVPNTNDANRARNRRVNIHLERVAQQTPTVRHPLHLRLHRPVARACGIANPWRCACHSGKYDARQGLLIDGQPSRLTERFCRFVV